MKGKSWLSLIITFSWLSDIQVEGIISTGSLNNTLHVSDAKKEDNVASQSIDRDYVAGYEDNHEHGGHGLSAHASFAFPEGYEAFGGFEHIKHQDYNIQDHHHHHHVDDHHHHLHHHCHDERKHYDYKKALAIKGLLVPLAGVALLGAAAAFVSNPILLQLGVISGSPLGRRKREIKNPTLQPKDPIRLKEIKLLERFISQLPKQEVEAQEKKMLAQYLSCSSATATEMCLERLACELHSKEGMHMPMEAKVLTVVVNEIMFNEFISDEKKIRILTALQRGKENLDCGAYACNKLEESKVSTVI